MARDARSALSEDARSKIEKLVEDTVASLGADYETVEIRYTKEYGKFNLTVFIWHPDEVTLDDCEKVHGAVTDDDFRRALGTEIEAITPDCTFRGTLTGYTAEDFTIVTLGKYEKEKTINRNNKTKVQPYIGF